MFTWSYPVYLLFLYLGTIWLSSCRRYTEADYLEHGGTSNKIFSCADDSTRKVSCQF
uniref:Uncharacterized protein n=1 Tax=Sparus aurata TaxID=8175 RepID=A0A671XLT1_SPAAU